MADQFAKKQHFVPQFILRSFADASGLIAVIDKQKEPLSARKQSPKDTLVENDMYETKNADGTYFERNTIENRFAQIEGYISSIVYRVENNADEELVLSGEEDAALALFTALQLVRLPVVKNVLCNSHKGRFTSDEEKGLYDKAAYRMLLFSDESGFTYLKENGLELSNWAKSEVEGKNLLTHIWDFISNECAIYLIKAEPESRFIISDNPVLIDDFPDAKYVFPISPQLAVCCCLWDQAKDKQDGGCIEINADGVDKINQLLFDKANRWVVCKIEDSSFVCEKYSVL